MTNKLITAVLATSLAWVGATAAQAATWRAIALGTTPDISAAGFIYPSATFTDGEYSAGDIPARGAFILSDNPNIGDPTFVGERRDTIRFQIFDGTDAPPPVSVNTLDQTITLGSIFFTASEGDFCSNVLSPADCFSGPTLVWRGLIGELFGAANPVPYVVNPDGTFTASWVGEPNDRTFSSSPNGNSGLIGETVYFTFAPVPEPAPVALFAVGVTLLFGLARRRRSLRSA